MFSCTYWLTGHTKWNRTINKVYFLCTTNRNVMVLQLTQYMNAKVDSTDIQHIHHFSSSCRLNILCAIDSTNCLHCLDCVLGPATDEDEDKDNSLQRMASSHLPPVHPFAHNAFHVWDQDEVIVPLPHDESPQTSPLLLAAIPYIPSFFPLSHSPTGQSSPTFSSSSGPI